MYLFAYGMQLLALFCALFGGAAALHGIHKNTESSLGLQEKAALLLAAGLLVASALLLHALYWNDFSLVYVASYTDRELPVFYRLTAFWAGQAGSMLFWALAVALCGAAFVFSSAYKKLSSATKHWYWAFYFPILAFFALVLTVWNNPFMMQLPVPPDGNSLNPLLQNPGMIFHPPLLFLGYGGFVIPGCLALAQTMSGNRDIEGRWTNIGRPFTLVAWSFLTAGIVLGGWWSYMELGWGGYWAWDPVENASLIPWLVGTAALHTGIIENRRGKLARVNVFLMALTTISAFFATYLVRSGVVDSLHAFGDGGVGTPLLIFICLFTLLSLLISFSSPDKGESLAGLETREGLLVLVAWMLLILSIVILVATMWPVFSKFWTTEPVGLAASFYNRVCTPLFAVLAALLAVCPWLGWDGSLRNGRKLLLVLGVFVGSLAGLWAAGFRVPVALLSSAAAVAALLSLALHCADKAVYSVNNSLAACGVHIGLALMVLGIAFSGPYKQEQDMMLARGAQAQIGPYTVQLKELYEGEAKGYIFLEAELDVFNTESKAPLGVSTPQRRVYHKFGQQAFAEAATMPSLGDEFYATLLGVDSSGRAQLKISLNPLINWVWIGGTLMCIFPFLALRRRRQ